MYRDKEPWWLEKEWCKKFEMLKATGADKKLLEIINACKTPKDFEKAVVKTKSGQLKNMLEMYLLTNAEVKKLKQKLNN